jgi:FtsP/CotA-like multicopper oxidase with cupredoxin domain
MSVASVMSNACGAHFNAFSISVRTTTERGFDHHSSARYCVFGQPGGFAALPPRPRLRFAVSYRDVEDLLAERESIRRWVLKFAPLIMLADFSFTPPEQIYEGLRKRSGMPAVTSAAPSAGAVSKLASPSAKTMSAKPAMAGMAKAGASATPLNDVKYDAFLTNDRTLADPEVIQVEPGGSILLRVINSSSMSAYHLDLGALSGELIAVDRFRVHPIAGQRFPIIVSQRLDIRIVIPHAPAAHPVLAILEGERRQTGVVLLAGRAPVTRIPEIAPLPSPALTLDLERRLRATEPLAPRKADRIHQVDLTGVMEGYVWSINGVAWNKDVPPLPITAYPYRTHGGRESICAKNSPCYFSPNCTGDQVCESHRPSNAN